MILTNNIIFQNFKKKKNIDSLNKKLNLILQKKNEILKSMTPKLSIFILEANQLQNSENLRKMRIIGMGGSILGTKAIYEFFKFKN